MKTFESVFKDEFESMLSKFIDNEIDVSNDISHNALKNNPDSIRVVIKTGLGQTSTTSFSDLINTTFTIHFIVNDNNLQNLLGALNSLIWNYNAEWYSLKVPILDISTDSSKEILEDKTFIYLPIFSTPAPLGSTSKLTTKNATISVVDVVMNISVSYSSNTEYRPNRYYIQIEGQEYEMNPISYDITSAPAYEPILTIDGKYAHMQYMNESKTYTFTFLKTIRGRNRFLDILSGDFFEDNPYMADESLSKTSIYLLETDLETGVTVGSIDITSHILEERYENGISYIILTLSR